MPPQLVSVVLPCRNEKNDIEECLASILKQDLAGDRLEVIVADGMSDDGTRTILQRMAGSDDRIRIIDNPHRIVSTGLNEAIEAASGDVIIRMDAHTRYAPDYIANCLQVLRETGADNVGGPWVAEGRGFVGKAIAAAFQSSLAFGGARGHDPVYEGPVDTVYLGCWPRDVFDRIGRFDEELVRNQDDEFNFRLLSNGGRIWQSPRIRSWYRARNSLVNLFNQYRQYGYWKVRVIQKHGRPASFRHLVPAAFVLGLAVLALASIWVPLAGVLLLSGVAAYSAVLAVASVSVAAATRNWSVLPCLPLVFACYHCAYGYGFLCGLVDFAVLKRQARDRYTGLTRPSV